MTQKSNPTLHTERLTLMPYREADRERMIELLTNERIKQTFMIPDFDTPEAANRAFEKLLRYARTGEHYELGVYRDGALIGFFNDVETGDGFMEIGYVIHPDHQGQGYATEALAAVIQDLFSRGYREVRAAAFRPNTASRRVMEKCGMRLTQRTESFDYHGRRQECVCYEITRGGEKGEGEARPSAARHES